MKNRPRRASWIYASLSILLSAGCGEVEPGSAGSPPGTVGAQLPPASWAAPAPGIKRIMTRLAKGPTSLTPVLGGELKAEQPPWETIQAQTKEYASLAAEMAKYDPPKGSKDSWARLTGEYAGSAVALDKAAIARDKAAALAAHDELARSCMACHREHRNMGPGGGMGGPPGGPGGGPPPR